MRFLVVFTLVSWVALLSACGGAVEPDEALFDTWIEPRQGGEIIFHRDKTVSWFDLEGTWEMRQDNNFARCASWGGCDKQIEISLPGHSFSVPFKSSHLDARPNQLFLAPSRGGSEVTVPIYDLPGCYLNLYREGSFAPAIMPSHFENMNETLPEGFNFNQTASVWMENQQIWHMDTEGAWETYGGRLNSSNHLNYNYRLNVATSSWELMRTTSYNAPTYFTTEELVYRREFGNGVNNGGEVSFDNGSTWKAIPNLSDDAWIETSIVGAKLVRSLTHRNNNDDFIRTEIWVLNSEAVNPVWELRHTFTQDGYLVMQSPNVSIVGETQLLTYSLHSAAGEPAQSFMSTDVGATWMSSAWPCTGRLLEHPAGLFCTVNAAAGSLLHWYDASTKTWTEHAVDFDEYAVVDEAPLSDGVYFMRDGELWSWQRDGSETYLMNVTSSFSYLASRVLGIVDGYVYVDQFGLWRAQL